ncbi:response regulator [Novosphingobium mathurense]|uniref:Response regulator receiver domain-containing protein n=1 Tax=Novosphingobium mathurense TaxID=428990 RepID=A0A1U6HKR3_9SPHN|nr:response regulator [Novosphingobium mathurense]SLJ96406.1 Response regulator receiver domain-containing protein [Novosphingobium mathurense]
MTLKVSLPEEECQTVGAKISDCAKILIVEDEFLLALQLEDILADGGYAVLGTVPDTASLAKLGEAPDIALVDLNLRDGLTGPAIARDLAGRYGARVIYVTANPAQIDMPAATAVGVVQKPFSRQSILAAITYALAGCPETGRPRELEPLRQV